MIELALLLAVLLPFWGCMKEVEIVHMHWSQRPADEDALQSFSWTQGHSASVANRCWSTLGKKKSSHGLRDTGRILGFIAQINFFFFLRLFLYFCLWDIYRFLIKPNILKLLRTFLSTLIS